MSGLVDGKMQVACFMSGCGYHNTLNLIEHEMALDENGASPFHVAAIFSDTQFCNARLIADRYKDEGHKVSVIINDMKDFYASRGKPLEDLAVREEYDAKTVELLKPYGIYLAALAGYDRLVTKPLIESFPLVINIHPSDMSIKDINGETKYVGSTAIRDAILAGEENIYSTIHQISSDPFSPEIDCSNIMAVSRPVKIIRPKRFDVHNKQSLDNMVHDLQNRLKTEAEYMMFPKTVEDIARGKYSYHDGSWHYDNKPIPQGLRLGLSEETHDSTKFKKPRA